MDEFVIFVNGTDRRSVDAFVESLRHAATQVTSIHVFESEQIIGNPEFTIAISASFGLGVIAERLAQVIVAWIKRNNTKSVKVGKTEIKGYSIEEVERILQAHCSTSKKK